ncbi:Transposon Ty3-G Gag-Pol polyprotein [Thelohanellus kitauei]|uniref:Transposon Ty3-G Gag-Pol polyprotein n=1 Tax=Thelohanellus kitauei TaxID=669202 RepID=A0A0C2JYW5_THEKT|nr:Transposon Ty3-G Gag-Pol polyprotein [Thelohanellus kitauei]
MLNGGIFRLSASPWRALLNMQNKKDGSLIFCSDYMSLNKYIIRDQYPLNDIKIILTQLCPLKFFTTLDSQKAYFQEEPHEPYKVETAFSVGSGKGIFECNVMHFGINNAPADAHLSLKTFLKTYRSPSLI